jgi:hypothetical protein
VRGSRFWSGCVHCLTLKWWRSRDPDVGKGCLRHHVGRCDAHVSTPSPTVTLSASECPTPDHPLSDSPPTRGREPSPLGSGTVPVRSAARARDAAGDVWWCGTIRRPPADALSFRCAQHDVQGRLATVLDRHVGRCPGHAGHRISPGCMISEDIRSFIVAEEHDKPWVRHLGR